MSLFQELYALATGATLTMIVSADEKTGALTISVLPKPKKDTGEAALTRDLTLTASPEEFDAGFVEALRGYREVRQSLAEQAAATCEVLAAAKSLSTKAATEAITKGNKAHAPRSVPAAPVARDADDASGDEDGDSEAEDAAEHTEDTGPRQPARGESLQLFG